MQHNEMNMNTYYRPLNFLHRVNFYVDNHGLQIGKIERYDGTVVAESTWDRGDFNDADFESWVSLCIEKDYLHMRAQMHGLKTYNHLAATMADCFGKVEAKVTGVGGINITISLDDWRDKNGENPSVNKYANKHAIVKIFHNDTMIMKNFHFPVYGAVEDFVCTTIESLIEDGKIYRIAI